MIVAIMLIVIAIAYAVNYRSKPVKIIYSGIGLLIAGAVYLSIASFILSNMGPVGTLWKSQLAETSIKSMLIVIPAGIIMTIIGLLLHQKSKG